MGRLLTVLSVFIVCSLSIHAQVEPRFDESKLQINWELIANNYTKVPVAALSSLQLKNNGNTVFPASAWTIYFNYSRKILPSVPDPNFIITHINGDFYQIKPSDTFQGLRPNQSLQIRFLTQGTVLNVSAAPSGFYMVWDSNPDKGISINNFVAKSITDSSVNYSTPEITFENNKEIKTIPMDSLPKIFPTPKVFKKVQGNFILDSNTSIFASAEFLKESNYLSNELSKVIDNKLLIISNAEKATILLSKKEGFGKEEYELSVQNDKIEISASTSSGVFYGIQSLKSLLPSNSWKEKSKSILISNCYVKDEPRFEYRGFMFDVARNFQTKETIFKILDAMSLYKMNVFHFHFCDDEGWRVEIPSLPELTAVGSNRGFTLNSENSLSSSYGSGPNTGVYPGSGYYSREDFIEILKYATERHIEVIPEIESPGHSRAAIKAMESRYNAFMKLGNQEEAEKYLLSDLNDKSIHSSAQYWNDNVMCVALPSTYTFMEKVIDEILGMYKEAKAPISTIHLGADEVPLGSWKLSPISNKLISDNSDLKTTDDLWYYYFDKMETLFAKRNLSVSGWEEIAMRKTNLDGKSMYIPNPDFANKGFRAYVWNNVIGWGSEDLPYKLANSGYKVVLSGVSNLYFDLAYEEASDEPGAYWGGFNDINKPFYFIPFDYYKNTKEDISGNPIKPSLFIGKDRLTEYGKTNILGIQGQLFSENIRNTATLEYLLLPKLLGLAERSWAENPNWAIEADQNKSDILYNKAWSVFVNVLGKKELPRLDYYSGGFKYRIPPVGAIIDNGKVIANIQIPGFTIRYTTDGSVPTTKSKVYQSPISVKGKITFCAFSDNERKGKLTVVENK